MEGLAMNSSFWSGRKVFVTGHTGFKGSWLSLWLQHCGADLTGYALSPPTHPNLFESGRVGEGMHSVLDDVRDPDRLAAAIATARPEVVFHLAAQPLVRESYSNPVETYSTNVMGTVHLLDAARKTDSIRSVVIVTSDKCYANNEWIWGYRECDPMGGHDPYSSSKGCTELVTDGFRRSFFSGAGSPAVASARAGNVIGGGDWARDRLIPDILTYIAEGQPVPIRNPSAVRPWQHVLEPLNGYLMLAEALVTDGAEVAEAWNFGPDDDNCRPVAWLTDELMRRWGGSATWDRDDGKHPHEAVFLKLDSSKSRQRLGWTPRLSIDRTLDWIVNWHKQFAEGANARDLTLANIEDFARLA
jgi:CDP-glucose 4,6-dehydratase